MMVAGMWALFNESLMILSVLFASVGLYLIRKGHRSYHRRLMIVSAVLGTAFFVSYIAGSLCIGDTAFGGPQRYRDLFHIILFIHVSSSAAVLGISTIWLASKQRFSRHRHIAPWAATVWFISAGTGLAVYLLLFVVFPPGPTSNHLLNMLTGQR